jgi:hypothetical protein
MVTVGTRWYLLGLAAAPLYQRVPTSPNSHKHFQDSNSLGGTIKPQVRGLKFPVACPIVLTAPLRLTSFWLACRAIPDRVRPSDPRGSVSRSDRRTQEFGATRDDARALPPSRAVRDPAASVRFIQVDHGLRPEHLQLCNLATQLARWDAISSPRCSRTQQTLRFVQGSLRSDGHTAIVRVINERSV